MKEEARTNETRRSLVVPFLVGGLVGAGVMLLLAPKSGKEIRSDLRNAAINSRDRIISAVDKGKEIYEQSRSAVVEAFDAGKAAYTREKEQHKEAA